MSYQPNSRAAANLAADSLNADLTSLTQSNARVCEQVRKAKMLHEELSLKVDQLLRSAQVSPPLASSIRQLMTNYNVQYLQLQSQMQNENRSYTAVSNIMKTKHDTVKNSISNVR